MSFIDDIKNCLFGSESISPPFRLCLIGSGAAYIENVTGIKSFSTEEISVYLKKGGLTLKGKGLYIKKFCEGDLAVAGEIYSVERV